MKAVPAGLGLYFRVAAFTALAGCSVPCLGQEATVHVQKTGAAIVIDVEISLAASADTAWAVLTDYDHMTSFLSNLTSSRVLRRDGDSLEVAQSGHTKVAFMTFAFSTVRAVQLIPKREIRSSLVSGDFKSYLSTTRIVESDVRIKIIHHGDYVPTTWMPPLIGPAVIESQTRKQYDEIAAEIKRRDALMHRQ